MNQTFDGKEPRDPPRETHAYWSGRKRDDLTRDLSFADSDDDAEFVDRLNARYPRARLARDIDAMDRRDIRNIYTFAKNRQRTLDQRSGYGAARTDTQIKRDWHGNYDTQQTRYLKRPGERRRNVTVQPDVNNQPLPEELAIGDSSENVDVDGSWRFVPPSLRHIL